MANEMEIVHLYDGHEKVHDGRGSVPDVVWSLATRTADRGHEVTVIERQWADLPLESEHEGVTFRRLSLRTGSDEPWDQIPYEMVESPIGAMKLFVDRTYFAIRSYRLLSNLDFDVLHVHLPFAANVLTSVARPLRKRIVYTAHLGETENRVSEPVFSPDAYLAKRCAKTVALNPKIKQAFVDRGVPEDRLVIVPNGVDIDRFNDIESGIQRRVRAEFGPFAGTVVLFVGTVTPRKGVLELVEAASEVVSTVEIDVKFLIVGRTDLEPDYLDQVRETITDAGLEDYVTLTGFVSEEELLALYELGDVFVLPSYEEGSSIAVSEALAAGIPVIGSDIDGITQQIEDGTHGYLVEPGATAPLASAIIELVEDPETRATMQGAIQARARELSWDRVTDEMIAVYQQVAR